MRRIETITNVCPVCFAEYHPYRVVQIYCSPKCKCKQGRRVFAKRHKKEPTRYMKKCAFCGEEFETYVRQQVYCSSYCKNKAWRWDNAEKVTKQRHEQYLRWKSRKKVLNAV